MASFIVKSSFIHLEEVVIKVTCFRTKEEVRGINIDLILQDSTLNLVSINDLNAIRLVIFQLRNDNSSLRFGFMNKEQAKSVADKIEELIG